MTVDQPSVALPQDWAEDAAVIRHRMAAVAAEGGEWLSLLGGTDGLVVSGAVLGLADGDGAASVARLSVRPAAVREDAGATAVEVRAELDGTASATRRMLTVTVGGGTGTAASGEDYAAVAEFELAIVAGATSGTAEFTLTPTDDGAAEGFETVSVVATGELPVAGARLAIADDDGTAAGALLGVWPAMAREGSGATAVTVTAALDGAVASSQRVLTVAVSPMSPGGFALGTARVLTIEAGRTASSNTVTMTAVADGHDAPDQVVTVSGAASGGHGTASPVPRLVTVADDDTAALTVGPAMIGVATDDADGDIYTVALATLPSGPVTVRVDGTAGTGLIVTHRDSRPVDLRRQRLVDRADRSRDHGARRGGRCNSHLGSSRLRRRLQPRTGRHCRGHGHRRANDHHR